MLHWREIQSLSDPVIPQFGATYEASFPIEVRVPQHLIVARIEKKLVGEPAPGVYHLGVAFDGDAMVGGAVFDFLNQTNIGFIDYIFVDRQVRSRGIGQFIYDRVSDTLVRDASRLGQEKLQGILFEIEKEGLATQAEERQQRVRRLRFFLRMGAGIISGLSYLQPPLHPGEGPLPMHLMFHPMGLPEDRLSGSLVLSWISSAYTTIYLNGFGVSGAVLRECLQRVTASTHRGQLMLRRPVERD